jgi:hypothetical protein
MRLSEKTIELTFCHQAGQILGPQMIWFGLTQDQESKLGFDVCTQLNGRLFVIQFKASSKILKRTNERQFKAPHDQMTNLKRLCRGRRAIYYAFPMVGTTAEIVANTDLLSQTWLLDVASLPSPVPDPMKKDGTGIRKSRIHYVNVKHGTARICSEEFVVDMIKPSLLFGEILRGLPNQITADDRYGLRLEDKQSYELLRKSVKSDVQIEMVRRVFTGKSRKPVTGRNMTKWRNEQLDLNSGFFKITGGC